MMNKIEYKKILDLEWSLRRAEIAAKLQWDKMFEEYGKDLLYDLNHEWVKELREAQKSVKEMTELLSKSNQLQYSE